MVGTPKSTGCATCRKRKKKCGLEKPACTLCINAGWDCPGYSKTWKFVDENRQLALVYRKKNYVFEDHDSEPVSSTPSVFARGALSESTRPNDLEPHKTHEAGFMAVPTGVAWPLYSDGERTGSLFSYILADPKGTAIYTLQTIGGFVSYIPSRLGRNNALDKSIVCLCSIYVDLAGLSRKGNISNVAIKRYTESLRALQQCLDDAQTRYESETVCASIILQLCELCINPDNERWNNLSKGTEILICNSGTARYASGFERAMLESQRAMFIAQAINKGEESFLTKREWRELLKAPVQPANPTERIMYLRSQLCEYLIDIPAMIMECSRLLVAAKNPQGIFGLQPRVASLKGRVASMKHSLETWFAREVEPGLFETTSRGPEGEQSMEYSGPGLLNPVFDCIVNSSLVLLEKMISGLESLEGTQVSEVEFQSISYVRRRRLAEAAHTYVKIRSAVCAKPLELGLQQLSAAEDGLNAALEARVLVVNPARTNNFG